MPNVPQIDNVAYDLTEFLGWLVVLFSTSKS
jgi:hypothetical protein